jgi:hypothetical protein
MHDLFNLTEFTPTQHAFYVASTVLWVLAYAQVARDAFRYRWLALPAAAVVANLGWEIVFSTVVTTRLGQFYVWGARAWLLFDAVLLALLLRLGPRQVRTHLVARNFTVVVLAGIALWSAGVFAFVREFHDVIGGFTGYILNIQMSALFLVDLANHPTQRAYSVSVGVLRMLGTVVILFAELVAPAPSLFVLVLGHITLGLDLTYIALLARRDRLALALEAARDGTPSSRPAMP